MTQRLYYDDAYLTEFEATVQKCAACARGYEVFLDRSAFYPTSGGQPFDTGTISSARVLDVFVTDGGEVAHVTDARLDVGARVFCKIDWARRFDHMQQHAGDHLLAGALYRLHGGYTIGLHLGEDVSTIDVKLPNGATRLAPDALAALEIEVNREIQGDHPIKSWFPSDSERAALPLRKEPTVKEHIRVVLMGDFECVACGGTHPGSTGQLGALKILNVAPSKGNMRVSFVCGMRAIAYFMTCAREAQAASVLLSTGIEQLESAVSKNLARLKDAEYHLKKERAQAALDKIETLFDGATALPLGGRLVCANLPGLDAQALCEAASAIIARGNVCALLSGGDSDRAKLIFARSPELQYDMGALLRESAKAAGGRGGGRADFAQGAGDGILSLDYAKTKLLSGASPL